MVADLDKARTRSVDNLQRLYTFVVSLAFAEGLRRTLLTPNSIVDLSWSNSNRWIMCLGLIVTAIPFYHGANRYLDATYVTGERSSKMRYSLMVDFFFLFLQALLMFTLALLITSGDSSLVSANDKLFFGGLALLLAIDVVWIMITRWTTNDGPKTPLQFRRWAWVNILALAGIVVLLFLAMWKSLLVLLVCRSAADYLIAHEFYYPSA